MCLRSEVTPMEFPEIKEVIEQQMVVRGMKYLHLFPIHHWDQHPLHRSTDTGLPAVNRLLSRFKRTGIYEIMAIDIGLSSEEIKLMPPISRKEWLTSTRYWMNFGM